MNEPTCRFEHRMLSIKERTTGAQNESGIALLSAIIFMILMAGMSVVLLSVVLGQIAPAINAQKGTRTIYAAQAGLQTSLGVLRTIPKPADALGVTYGDPAQLPCSDSEADPAIEGNVDGQSNGITYAVTIFYYKADPTGQNEASRAGNLLSCAQVHSGTQPKFALLESTGHAPRYSGVVDTSPGDRKLSAVYKFKIPSNANISGGRIYTAGSAFCFEAIPLDPSLNVVGAGSLIKFSSSCTASASNDPKQLWVYDKDYEIKLASSTLNGAPGLCITGPVLTTDRNLQNAILQPCRASSDVERWNQLWSWTGSYTWQGQNRDPKPGKSTTDPSGYYLGGSISEGQLLQVRTAVSGTFEPSTAVGAGAASYNTHQLVNYLEFGRCADVTGAAIGTTFEISYPCKQDASGNPNSPNLLWNHKWFYNEPTSGSTASPQDLFVIVDNGTKYCLQTPSGAGIYPLFSTTCGTSQKWVRVKDTGVYIDSYVMKDNLGRCLAVDSTGPKFAGTNNTFFSKLIVATCNGSLAQKWNAPPAYTNSTIGGYKEVSG